MGSWSRPSGSGPHFGDLRRSLIGPYALRPLTIVVMICWVWLRGLAASASAGDVQFGARGRELLVVTVAVALMSWLVGQVLLGRRISVARTLTGYVLIGVVLTIAPMNTSVMVPVITVTRLILAVVYLTVMAYLLDAYQHYRSQVARLQHQQRSLVQTRDQSKLAIAAARRQLGVLIDDRIGSDVQALAADVRRLESEPPTARELRNVAQSSRLVATDKVRELSHQLIAVDRSDSTTTQPLVNRFGLRPGSLRQMLRNLPGSRPFHPVAVGLTFGVGVTSLSSVELSDQAGLTRPGAVLSACLAVIAVMIAAFVSLWLWRTWIVRLSQSRQIIAVAVLYLFTAFFAASILWLVVLLATGRMLTSILVGVPIGVLMCSLAWCVIGLVAQQVQATTSALQSAVMATQWELRRVQSEEHQLHRAVSLALHGDIQSKLTINAMLLDELANRLEAPASPAIGASGTRASAVADDLALILGSLHELSQSLEVLTVMAGDHPPLPEALDELVRSWNGLAAIDRDVSVAAFGICKRSEVLAEASARICQEAVSNAVRHGKATEIGIVMRVSATELIVEVRDNGTWRDTDGAGLGKALLDELTSSWSLCAEPAGTTLIARLPAQVC